MKIWAITFDPSKVKNPEFDKLYTRCLQLVDDESQIKIKKYYRREDAFRSLVGRLLPRMILHERGVPNAAISFAKTDANKPYINIASTNSVLPEPIGFNITHDSGVVAMAYVAGANQPWNDPPAHRVGVDIMRLSIPDRFTFKSFVDTVDSALTTFEKSALDPNPPVSQAESLQHFFSIWTVKEAYTKALGLGLGFDFKRIEYDNGANRLKVDGKALTGWEFDVFQLPDKNGTGGYIGVGSQYTGGDKEAIIRKHTETAELVSLSDAEEFLNRALKELEDE